MTKKCEYWREGGGCGLDDNSVCSCVTAFFSDDEEPEPEQCFDYQRARAEKAEKRVAELETNWHDVSEENFRALWEAYAMAADETLTADAIRLKRRLRAIVTAPAPAQEGEE